jgi:hypothetical protein
MKRILVLLVVGYFCWLGCSKTETPIETNKPCVRTYDSTTTVDSYIEKDTFSGFLDVKTLDFKLKLIKIASQTGTCEAAPACTNILTITNNTNKTATVFYTIIGGPNVMIPPKSSKDEVVPLGAFGNSVGPCFTLSNLKTNMKVRY